MGVDGSDTTELSGESSNSVEPCGSRDEWMLCKVTAKRMDSRHNNEIVLMYLYCEVVANLYIWPMLETIYSF